MEGGVQVHRGFDIRSSINVNISLAVGELNPNPSGGMSPYSFLNITRAILIVETFSEYRKNLLDNAETTI